MYMSTTKVKTDSAGDRIIELNISERSFCIFTLNHDSIVIIESTNPYPILLNRRKYTSIEDLNKAMDELLVSLSKVINIDDFISTMDTYIDLKDSIKNELTEEIIHVSKIISED